VKIDPKKIKFATKSEKEKKKLYGLDVDFLKTLGTKEDIDEILTAKMPIDQPLPERPMTSID